MNEATDTLRNQWIISAEQANQLIKQGATILDSRNILDWLVGHASNAVHVHWQAFSQKQFLHKGKLIESSKILEQKLRIIGIFNDKPIIVIGNPEHPCNFGEEGRIVWMLRSLGHEFTAFVDGGDGALSKIGMPTTLEINKPLFGDFIIKKNDAWLIQRDELQIQLLTQKLTVIDTRSPREFNGATPYGEQRSGHIPGAINFYFKDLLNSKGYLLPRLQIVAQLNSLGITCDTPIVTYCTGGVRSAFFVAVLVDLGFTDVKNYAGSMWEWSAAPDSKYPLLLKQ